MNNDGRILALCSLAFIGGGLVLLAIVHVVYGREIPPATWQLLAAIAGGILALLPPVRPTRY